MNEVPPEAYSYAGAHGLILENRPTGSPYLDDNWYSDCSATTPIRMTLPMTSIWPLTEALATLFLAWPVMWPDERVEALAH